MTNRPTRGSIDIDEPINRLFLIVNDLTFGRTTVAKKKKKSFLSRLRPRIPRYFKESYREIRRVTWPSRKEAIKLTTAVIIFTAFFTLFAVLADALFDWGAEQIFL